MKDGKKLILCIDDDIDILDSLRITLEKAGYAVATAQSAEEGLKRYKEEKPELIIVDLMMEEVDAGTNFIKEIKALGPIPPVYMLSSVGDSLSSSIDYSSLGLSGVFQKPLKSELLIQTIRTRLGQK